MAITNCPHCHKSISLTAVGADKTEPEGQLGRSELSAVRRFLQTQQPGRQMTQETFDRYEFWRAELDDRNAPPLSKNALARALRAFGAEPWRNALGRGWVIPKIDQETRTPRPARTVDEAEARASYRDSVARSGQPLPTSPTDLSNLPLEVEGL